jgi:hypothetical protein
LLYDVVDEDEARLDGVGPVSGGSWVGDETGKSLLVVVTKDGELENSLCIVPRRQVAHLGQSRAVQTGDNLNLISSRYGGKDKRTGLSLPLVKSLVAQSPERKRWDNPGL